MTSWRPYTDEIIGVVIHSFRQKDAPYLPLCLGDTVRILEENSGWYHGFSLKNKAVKGIFPAAFVHTKESKKGAVEARVLELVGAITSALREWVAIWRQLFMRKEEETFNIIQKLMMELMDLRRQLMFGNVPGDQLKQKKQIVTSVIDTGNRLLSLDLIPRDDDGNPIDSIQVGVIDLYKRHVNSSMPKKTDKNHSVSNALTTHGLYVKLRSIVCRIGDDAEVYLTLYDAEEKAFISEHFMVLWDGTRGMPQDIEKFDKMSVVFTDLGSKDMDRTKIYIVCQVTRVGRMDPRDPNLPKFTQKLRRPYGVAVYNIDDIIHGTVDNDAVKETYANLTQIDSDFLENWIDRLIRRADTRSQAAQGTVWFDVRLLHGEMSQIREEYPLLVNQETVVARKLGFPEVIMPGDVRNDLYITIVSGEFDRGQKKSSKNIEVSMSVCYVDGSVLQDVICHGAGQSLTNKYRSNIYYHSGTSRWCETVKLSIPINKFFGSHIRFTFKHRSSKEDKDKPQKIFAVCFVKLMHADGTTLFDGPHDLFVYKCDLKEIEEKHCKVYLQLPASAQENAFSATANTKALSRGAFELSKEKFHIKSLLCSTKLTQNADLLKLLKWKEQKENLTSVLPTVMKVSGEEIVKFLQGIFDVLFAILDEDPQKYGHLVFDCLVFTIGLLADNKFQHFRPVLDTYIESLFHAAKAHVTLISVLRSYVDFANEPKLDKNKLDLLLKAMKALEYMIKYIVRSREMFEMTASGRGREEFENDMRKLFKAMIKMMENDQNDTLLVQGAALKYLPTIFADVVKVFDSQELGEFTRSFIQVMPPRRLSSQKMACIHQIVKCKLFENESSRGILLPMILQQLKANISNNEELKSCSEILCDILTVLHKQNVASGPSNFHIQLLVDNLFADIVQTVVLMDPSNPLAGVYVSSLIAILKLMKSQHYTEYISQFERSALIDFLTKLFLVFRELVSNCVYPSEWMVMIMVQNSVMLAAIQVFCRALCDKFLVEEDFEYQLWNNFFHLAVAFITQDSLQLQLFSDAKRNKILDRYADMRVSMAVKIKEMWHVLGKHKSRFIPELVGPCLEATLIPENDLRRSTIPLFFDMILVDFKLHGHFQKVENEVITKLDVLVEGGRGDEEYKELMKQILEENFRSNAVLKEKGLDFVKTVTDLLDKLLDYRSVISKDENIDNHMSCTVNLLNFYKDIRREEMYIRYLYKLCELHLTVKNYTEAAFTLLLHTDLLKWTDDPVDMTASQSRYQASTQRQLKELLYTDIIDYFDQGKTWEYGIKYCKDLARQYETETFEYIKLSKILNKQATFFDNIIKQQLRAEPKYFRVGFYGEGFPKFLKNKVFIFRGKEYETLIDFNVRMQAQFVNAQLMTKLTEPGPEILQSPGQYLQICNVDPVPVQLRRFQGKTVEPQILSFYSVNDIRTFKYSRPFHKEPKDKNCEFASLWIERTKMDTKYTLPGILRWFEVESTQKSELSPLENALETVAEKNHEMRALFSRYKSNPQEPINPLSMVLNGVIDAAVMGGTANYEKIFFVPSYIKKHPDHEDHIHALKDYMVEQVYILDDGVRIHSQRVTEELRPFHDNIEKKFKEMRSKILSSYSKTSTVNRSQSLPRVPSEHGRISIRHRSQADSQIPEDIQKRNTPFPEDLSVQELHRTKTIYAASDMPRIPEKKRISAGMRRSTLHSSFDGTTPRPLPSLPSGVEEAEEEEAPAKPPRHSSPLPPGEPPPPETPPKTATLPAGFAPPLPGRQRPLSDRSSSGSSLSTSSMDQENPEQSPVLPPRTSFKSKTEDSEPPPALPPRK